MNAVGIIDSVKPAIISLFELRLSGKGDNRGKTAAQISPAMK